MKKRHGNLRVIPNNMERYLAVSIGQVQFLDSFQFTMKSLDDLVATMSDEDFVFMRQLFPTDDLFDVMKRKCSFPYVFFDSISKLYYDEFPSRTTFFNKLENKECSDNSCGTLLNVSRLDSITISI